MPLQSSGQISLGQIRNEFKQVTSGSVRLGELYRAGSFVPNEVFCHNNTIPSTGTIKLTDFRNTTKGALFYTNINVNPLPANANRCQISVVGGGGGSSYINLQGNILYRYAASGGGGGYSTYSVTGITTGQYFGVTVGAGGIATDQYFGAAGSANSGTDSVVSLTNSGGTVASSYSAPRGIGGQAYQAGGGGAGVAGTGGVGNTGTGGNGTGAKNNTDLQVGGAGGWSGQTYGKGGNAHATNAAQRTAGNQGVTILRF